MSSKFEDNQSAIGSPVGVYFHGESIAHWPLAVEDNAVAIDVIWDEMEPETQYDRGKGVIRKAVAVVDSAVSVSKKDAWVRNSVRWETEAIGPNCGGLREVHLIRREGIKSQTLKNTNRGR